MIKVHISYKQATVCVIYIFMHLNNCTMSQTDILGHTHSLTD